jgi:AcrR family transcriptional regulator
VISRRPGRPSRAEAERRIEHLLDVAAAAFIELGYSAATMEHIAQAAGFWKQAIYQRYGDKSTLFAAVVQRLAELQPLRFPPPDELPLKQGLQLRIHYMLTAVLQPEGQAIYKLFIRNSHHFPELTAIIAATANRHFAIPLSRYLRAQRRRGGLRKVNIEVATKTCMDLVYGRMMRFFLIEGGTVPAREVNKAAREIVGILIGGLAEPD